MYREGIVSTIDAIRDTRLTPALREKLKTEAGYDDDKKLPTYPISALDRTVQLLAADSFPFLPPDEAQFRFGLLAMRRYGESTLGKALFPLVRLLGPMKFLKRMPQLFRQTNNYADVKVEVLSPTSYQFDHNEVSAIPHYFRGVMEASGAMIGLKDYHCTLVEYDGHHARYRIDWSK